ncbi:MFS transporter [Amycolatopsis jejuensis]|uniref:MFS transporter n=1 Tax=Amycolatopsis jejuensis TaxID=330084 RepID=UPI00068E44DA|nr:MFS transporter [Amycolatopsis jejuensis]
MTSNLPRTKPAPVPVPEPHHGRAWAVTVMLVLLALINWADKAVLGLVAVPLMRDLGIGPGEYGLLASAIYFLFAVSAVFAGFLANRRSTKWMLVWMVVIWSVSQYAIWLAPTFLVIFLARIVLGFGEGPSAGLSFHAAAKWFPDEKRTLPVALQNVGAFGGIAVAAPALTWIISHHDWHWAFFAVGTAGVVWLLIWLFVGREGPLDGSKPAAKGTVFDSGIRVRYRTLLTTRSFIGATLVGLSAYWGLAVLSAWLPAYLRTSHGYSATAAANIVMGVSLTAVGFLVVQALLTSAMMKRGVSSRIARSGMASLSTALAGGFVIISAGTSTGALQIVVLCLGFGLGLVTFTTGAVTISEFVPVLQRGAVLGLYVAILTSAGVFAPAVFGWIVSADGAGQAHGYTVALLVSGVFIAFGGVAGLVLINPKRDIARIAAAAG